MFQRLTALFLLVFLIHISVLGGQNSSNKAMTAYKVKDLSIVLDGKLNEPIWKNQPIKDFTQKDPVEGKPATEETDVWVAYDDTYIYVAAKLHDSDPSTIDASLARRDSGFDSDWFYFFVDPYNDKKTGYYFGVNAGGSIKDGVLFNDSWDDNTWDGVWEAKTAIEGDGWTVEMRIPFSQLRFKDSDHMTWGVNFRRNIKRNNESSFYVMVPKKESGFVSHFASLEGLKGIKPKQRLEILPYVVQKGQSLVHDSEDPFYKGNQFSTNVGADLKIGIGSSLNIDATINPDFGQVEVDPAVVNLSAFETFFDEKRPFFMEGSNTFYYGIGGVNNNWGFNFSWPELFYSRRIGRQPQGELPDYDYADIPNETRILGAAKLTGKLNETTTIGAISALTERTYASLKYDGITSRQEVEPLTHYGVFRAKKEFSDGDQGLGFMFTSVNRNLRADTLKSLLANQAYTFGTDGWFFLDKDKEYVISGAVAGSYISGSKNFLVNLQEKPYRYYQRPDAVHYTLDSNRTSLAGFYTRWMLNKQNGNFYINTAIGAMSPGFEFNDLGFQWMADRINGHVVLGYRWFDPDSLFRNKSVYVAYARSYNFDGYTTNNFLWSRANFQFMNYYGFGLNLVYFPEHYSNTLTRGGPLTKTQAGYEIYLNTYTDSRATLSGEASVDYNNDASNSYYYEIYTGITWRPNTQITFSIGPDFSRNRNTNQWIDNFDDPTAVNTYKIRYVFGELLYNQLSANIRLNWTFTPNLSLQLFLQPLFAVGKYNHFKELAAPRTYQFNNYDETGAEVSYNADDAEYTVDPDGNGPADPFSFDDPDFNFKSLRGNVVLRWEVVPGSVFYFAWSHNQTNDYDAGDFNLKRDFKSLWNAQSDNIFLVKFSYWLNM